jgi:hypothetical protein
MTNKLSLLLGLICVGLFFHCQMNPAPVPVEVQLKTFEFKRCLDNAEICAEMKVTYPEVSGSDAALARRLTDSLQAIVCSVLDLPLNLPLSQHLPALADSFYGQMDADYRDSFLFSSGYSKEADTKIVLNAPRYLSANIFGYVFTGGAHGLGITILTTINKATGRALSLTEVVADTAALRPLVERAFLQANKDKDLGEMEATFENLLLEPDMPLPLTDNFCIEAEGIRMVYNPYEVTAYVFGPTEFLLTWEALGRLADRDRWLK